MLIASAKVTRETISDVSKAFRAGKMTANKVDSIMKSGVGSYLDDVGKELGYSFGKTGRHTCACWQYKMVV